MVISDHFLTSELRASRHDSHMPRRGNVLHGKRATGTLPGSASAGEPMKVHKTIRIDKATLEALERLAAKDKRTLSDYIRQSLERWITLQK